MGLLAEVLGDEKAGTVECRLAIVVDRAHDELGPIEIVDRATRPFGADLQVLHRPCVVVGGDQIVEDDPVGDLTGELHHLHAGGPDV